MLLPLRHTGVKKASRFLSKESYVIFEVENVNKFVCFLRGLSMYEFLAVVRTRRVAEEGVMECCVEV